MIKLTNIPEDVMDNVMELSREFNLRPDKIIKIMLGLVCKTEAKKAINNEQKMQGTK